MEAATSGAVLEAAPLTNLARVKRTEPVDLVVPAALEAQVVDQVVPATVPVVLAVIQPTPPRLPLAAVPKSHLLMERRNRM